MSGKTYMVIGSNSFSGGWMVDMLLEDKPENKVIGISRSPEKSPLFLPYLFRDSKNFTFHQIDINNDTHKLFDLLDSSQPEYVINFAAQGEVGTSWLYPEQWFQTNTVAIAKICNFLKKKKYLHCYVHISTPEVYGSCNNVSESAPMNPSTPYAASKAAGDLFIFTLVKEYNFPMLMIRSTNVFGKHQQLYRIVPRTIIYFKMGKKVQLHGGGKAIKSYIHIKDVCRGIIAAMKLGKFGSIYHFSPDKFISIKDLVEKICNILEYDFENSVEIAAERPGQDTRYVIDSSKARRELSWSPTISLEDGLHEVIKWITGNYNRILNEPLDYIHIP